jgi:hypothetical protein
MRLFSGITISADLRVLSKLIHRQPHFLPAIQQRVAGTRKFWENVNTDACKMNSGILKVAV